MTDSDNNTVTIPLADIDTDNQAISSSVVTANEILNIALERGGNTDIDIRDADADPNNEIQTLTSTDGSVILTNTSNDYNLAVNFPANNDNSATNELTDLSLSSDILTLTNPATTGNQVDLSPYLDNTDDQFDDEVDLRTPIDVDEGGEATPVLETTVEEVIQAIAPITSKAARIFYPPSIAIDASTNGIQTIDLYQEYIDQFGSPTAGSAGARVRYLHIPEQNCIIMYPMQIRPYLKLILRIQIS